MKIHLRPHEYMRMRTKGEGWIYEDRPLATFSSRPSPALESLEGPAAESGEFNWDKKKRKKNLEEQSGEAGRCTACQERGDRGVTLCHFCGFGLNLV